MKTLIASSTFQSIGFCEGAYLASARLVSHPRAAKGAFRLGALLLASAALLATTGSLHAKVPKLLYANGTSWGNMTPTNVHANTTVLRNTVNKFPFDGLILHSKAGEAVFDTTKSFGLTEFDVINTSTNVGTGTFAGTLLQHNFAKINSYLVTGQDPFTTSNSVASWTTTLSRAMQFAALCQAKGLKGVVVDTEDYVTGHRLFEWPRPDGGTYDRNFVAANARLRGNQLMAAIKAGFPNAVVLSYVGVQRHISYKASNPTSVAFYESGLQAAFFVGLVQARGSNLVVDGNENYSAKPWTAGTDFWYYVRGKYHYPLFSSLSLLNAADATQIDIIPTNMVASWPENESVSIANNDLTDDLLGVESTSVMQEEITKNLRRSDDYAWYYSEGNGSGTWGFDLTRAVGSAASGHPPSAALIAAIAAARDTANVGINSRIPGQVWFNTTFETPSTVADSELYQSIWTTGTWVTEATTRLGAATTSLTCAAGTGVAVVGNTNAPPDDIANGKLTWTDYDVEAWVRSTSTAGDRGILARYKNATNYYYFRLTAGTYSLVKRLNGVDSVLQTGAYAWSANTWYRLRLSVNRRDISCAISTDGTNYTTLVSNARDTAKTGPISSGTAAVKCTGAPITFDDVVVAVNQIPSTTLTATLGPGVLNLNWTGGAPPYSVEKKTVLSDALWMPVFTNYAPNASVGVEGESGFFRIRSTP